MRRIAHYNLLLAFVLLVPTLAHASPGWWHPEQNGRSHFRGAPLPYTCDTVRAAAKLYSPAEMVRYAKQFGVKVTPSQRREAAKCLAE